MKYIIHIGQSKTGTSSLQSFFRENRKALRSKGVLFPDVMIGNTSLNIIEHNSLADELAGFTRYPNLKAAEYFEQFEQQAKKYGCHTIILSAESFFGAPQIWRVKDETQFWIAQEKKIKELSKFVKNKEVHIIAYLRHQSDWFDSAVSQIIRTEGLLGHHIYENDKQIFEFLKPHMDYKRILGLWSKEFSSEALSVIPFDYKGFKNESIIDDFCERASLNMEGLRLPEKNENVGLDRRYIWLKNQLNQEPHGKAKERVIIALLSALNSKLEHINKYKISSTLRKEVYSFYAPINEKLCNEYSLKTPNILTMEGTISKQGAVTEEEKKEALNDYKKALYSVYSLKLFIRYSAGAFLRKRAPFLNAFLKKVTKI